MLGSTQSLEVVDRSAAEAGEVSVVRRRSGGGSVLVGTGDAVWVDAFVPAGDPLWAHDVGRATHWLGRTWVDTLAALGIEADWHDGPLLAGPWSSLVCFAGLGSGEVRAVTASAADGPAAKVVGISQRRTRAGSLFQCAALLHWDPAPILGLLNLDAGQRARAQRDLAGAAIGIADLRRGDAGIRGPTARAVEDTFVGRLSTL